ncbi:TetR family transcriptional regulator [Rhizobium albus]|nr:TetR family transcriptional regulator [Rhizobium albus]
MALHPDMSGRPPRKTPLADKIVRLIETGGPLSVSDYFHICLSDPQHGYYMTREPFGASGDFITAPEVTQLFGEMIAIFLLGGWQAAGMPRPVRLVELGPGRGTLMKDMLRTIRKVLGADMAGWSAHLVETSPRLRAIQAETLRDYADLCSWHERLEDVPKGHMLLAANELFDALPIRQFVKSGSAFREKVIGLDAAGELTFGIGPAVIEASALPHHWESQPEGTVFEVSPIREAFMAALATKLRAEGGLAAVIDYGHRVPGFGDTLQAMRYHGFDDPLAHPGEADLTSHVDFASLSAAAQASGAHVLGLTCQSDFLLGLGLLDRAGRLGADKDRETQKAIEVAVDRIAGTGPGRMGELFKVLAISSQPMDFAPFARFGEAAPKGR